MKPKPSGIHHFAKFGVSRVIQLISKPIYLLNDSKSLLKNSMDRSELPGSKVAVIAIFPDSKELRPDVFKLSEMLNQDGFGVLIVSNSRIQCEIPKGAIFFERENKGFDLSAVRDVLRILDTTSIDELLVINDSVYWSVEKFFVVLSELRAKGDGIWSLVESLQGGRHMQSFFFYLSDLSSQKVLVKGFMDVFSRIKNSNSKRHIVWYGEKMIYSRLKSIGIEIQPLYLYDHVLNNFLQNLVYDGEYVDRINILKLISKGIPLNPSLHLCESLIRMNAPFLKKSIVTSNPVEFTDRYASFLIKRFEFHD